MVRLLNGIFGLAVVSAFIGVTPQPPERIWAADATELRRIADLESRFEADRSDPDLAAELADEYLHEEDPELAVALLSALDADAARDPAVQHRLALAYADLGQISDAVASARLASSRCMREIEAAYAPGLGRCDETTLTRIEMNREALERLNRWGVVDPYQDPARTALAYSLSYRVARLAVSAR
jgi:hypothetical protein